MADPIRMSTGYASGLPIEDIISQLVTVQRAPLDKLTQQKTLVTQKQTLYNNIKTRTDSLLTALKKLAVDNSSILSSGNDIFKSKKATVSDSAVASASVSQTAASHRLHKYLRNP